MATPQTSPRRSLEELFKEYPQRSKLSHRAKAEGYSAAEVRAFLKHYEVAQRNRPELQRERLVITAPRGSYQADIAFIGKTRLLILIEIGSR